MPEKPSPSLAFDRTFTDFDELTDLARAWDVDFRQLEAGEFQGRLAQVICGDTHFSRVFLGRRIEQRGAPPPGLRTFAIPADPNMRLFWRGRWVTGNHILSFPPGGELEAVSLPGFDMMVFSATEAKLDDAARELDITRARCLASGVEVYTCLPAAMQTLRQRFGSVIAEMTGGHVPLDDLRARQVVDVELPQQLIITLASARSEKGTDRKRDRDRALSIALAYIDRHVRHPLTVFELTQVTRASERTLQYAFSERFGISPKSYLRTTRLNGAHKELRRANPPTTRVADAARRWGFSHMSQFAIDYRSQFSELPSETLQRRSE